MNGRRPFITQHDNPLVPDELDRVLEREEVERYVARVRRGDFTPQPKQHWTDQFPKPQEGGSHWDMEKILANWAALYGAAPSAARLLEPSPSPGSIQPTVRLVASRPSARASGASSTRRSNVTNDALVNQTVEDIMRERKVGKRWAYAILRQQTEEKATQAPVPHNQRERVLEILYRSDGFIRDSRMLTKALHDEGSEIDGHDTTKVLWSLQKTNHVKFREHQNPRYLYAIKLTDQGKRDGHRLVQARAVDDNELLPADDAGTMSTVEAVEEAYGVKYAEPVVEAPPAPQPEPPKGLSLASYPAINDLHERSLKAQKLAEAARLLEEAGEDDLALNLMGKTEFSTLEREVLDVFEKLGVSWA